MTSEVLYAAVSAGMLALSPTEVWFSTNFTIATVEKATVSSVTILLIQLRLQSGRVVSVVFDASVKLIQIGWRCQSEDLLANGLLHTYGLEEV